MPETYLHSLYPNLKPQIDEALQGGYSLQEVHDHISAKINEAKRQGWDEQEIGRFVGAKPQEANKGYNPFLAQFYRGMGAVNTGLASFAKGITEPGQYINEKLGLGRSKITDDLVNSALEVYKSNEEYWNNKAKDQGAGFIDELVGDAIGGGVPGVLEFMMGVPYSAAKGATEAKSQGQNEFLGAISEGVKRGLLGKLFKWYGQLSRPLAAGAMGVTMGAETAAGGGTPEQIAKATGTGAIYGMMGNGRIGVKEIWNPKKAVPEYELVIRDLEAEQAKAKAEEAQKAAEAEAKAKESPPAPSPSAAAPPPAELPKPVSGEPLKTEPKPDTIMAMTRKTGAGEIPTKETPMPEGGKKVWIPWRKEMMRFGGPRHWPEDLWLHGSAEETLKPSGEGGNFGGAIFLTKDKEFALGYAKQNENAVHGFRLKKDAKVLDVYDLNQVEELADALIKNKKFQKELMREDLYASKEEYRESLIDSIYKQDIHEHTDFENPIFQEVTKNLGYDLMMSERGMVALRPSKALEKYPTHFLHIDPNPSSPPSGGGGVSIPAPKATTEIPQITTQSPKPPIAEPGKVGEPKAKEPWEMTRDDIETNYPLIKGDLVDGRKVRESIPNQSSIEASVDNPTILPGVREIPMSMFEAPPVINEKTTRLAEAIKNSGEINPLIVVIDNDGPYILEGANRYDAMKINKAKSIPAMVVIDEGSFYEATKKALSEGKPVPPEVLKDYPDLAPKVPIESPGKAGETYEEFIKTETGKIRPVEDIFSDLKTILDIGERGEFSWKKKIPADRDGNELLDMDNVPMEINRDGTITIYHRTTPEKAAEIKKTGKFTSLENTDETFFSNKKEGQAEGYGETIIAVKVRPSDVRINDAFHGGEIHVAVPNKRLSKSNIIDESKGILGERGSFSIKEFTPEQLQSKREAFARLKDDADKLGLSIAEFLSGKGIDAENSKAIIAAMAQLDKKEEGPGTGTGPGAVKVKPSVKTEGRIQEAEQKAREKLDLLKQGENEPRKPWVFDKDYTKVGRLAEDVDKLIDKMGQEADTLSRQAFAEGEKVGKEIEKEKQKAIADEKLTFQKLSLEERAKVQKEKLTNKYEERLIDQRNQLRAEAVAQRIRADEIVAKRAEIKKVFDDLKKEKNQILSRIDRAKSSKSVDPDYHDQINGILSDYDLHVRTEGTMKEREATRDFIARQEAAGESVFIPEEKIALLRKKPLNDMTLAELRNLDDVVGQLEHLGKLKNKLLKARDKRTLQERIDRLNKSIEDNVFNYQEPKDISGQFPSERAPHGMIAKFKQTLSKLRGATKVEYLLDKLDGFKGKHYEGVLEGDAYDLIKRPEVEAKNDEMRLMQADVESLGKIMEPIKKDFKDMMTKQIDIDGRPMTKLEAILIYWNTRNAGNRDATAKGFWGRNDNSTDVKIGNIISTLSPKEKQFADDIMGLIQSKGDRIAETLKNLTGEKLKREKDYFPLWFDRELSDKVSEREQVKDLMKEVYNKFGVERGFTVARVGGTDAPYLSFDVVIKHLAKTNHFIANAEAVRDVQRVVFDPTVKRNLQANIGESGYSEITEWLKDWAHPQKGYIGELDKWFGILRNNTTLATLGFKMSTAVLQPTAYFQTINRLGFKTSMAGLLDFYSAPFENRDFIYNLDPTMRTRSHSFDRDLKDFLDSDKYYSKSKRFKEAAMSLIGIMDLAATLPTWKSAYNKALGEFKWDTDKAVEYAALIVRRTQGSGLPEDLPGVLRGNNFKKAFNMFYTYFSSTYNEAQRDYKAFRAGEESFTDVMKAFVWLFVLPAAFQVLLKKREETTPKEFGKELIGNVGGVIPYVGPIINAATSGFDYQASPIFELPKAITKGLQAKEPEAKLKQGVMAVGYATGFPARQSILTAQYLGDVLSGRSYDPLNLVYRERQQKGGWR